ncbi:MAG TPA: lysophospholipid acyltransferase family protein [Ideonella sp.]|nr:lysophospholipid acyltransferase family protein [Ideonella sp.]
MLLPSLLRWLSRRSLAVLQAWGAVAGWLAWWLSPTYRRRFVEQATQAGLGRPQWRPAIAHAGRMVFELPFLWLRDPSVPLAPLVSWRGAELVDEAIALAAARGTGVVFLTPHLGAFEVTAQAYAERWGALCPVTVLYRPARKAWLRDLVDAARARPGLSPVPATLAGVRALLRALKRGEFVGLLPDQVPPAGMGVWAPFFGRPAYTMTLAARLARASGLPVMLMRCERRPRGAGYTIHVSRMAEPLPADDGSGEAHAVASAAAINRTMEALIRECPEQYLWAYARYKAPRVDGLALEERGP